MKESAYQAKLIKRIKKRYPGCYVLKNDANYIQGIPDLLILYGDKWAMLEVKVSKDASHQPNQDFWVSQFNKRSFASFIYPENEEEVFDGLDKAFEPRR